MSATVSLNGLYQFSGWVVDNIDLDFKLSIGEVVLRPDARKKVNKCPCCGHPMGEMRVVERQVLDIPLGTINKITIRFSSSQGKCSQCCHFHTFLPAGIESNSRATDRLKIYVSRLCRFMPVNKASSFFPISDNTARRWDKEVLQRMLPSPALDGISAILIDETSIGKGHEYLTVVLNAKTGEVLHLAEGKRKSSLEGFFKKLSSEQKANIKAVGIDRSGSYQSVVKEQIPEADIVYDKFHIVSNYNDVIDEIRREECRQAEDDEDKAFIKGQRFNLFKNPWNLKFEAKKSLQELLAINENLHSAYVLKDALKNLWTYTSIAWAGRYLNKWIGWAEETGLEELIRFSKGLNKARKGLLSYCKHRITSAKIESFNATIKRIIRKACGYRDLDYLYLKIRQEAISN
jgi:transposase